MPSVLPFPDTGTSMTLNVSRCDNRWVVRNPRDRQIRGTILYDPSRRLVSIALNGNRCCVKIGQISSAAVFTLLHEGNVLRGALREHTPAIVHWKSMADGSRVFNLKSSPRGARIVWPAEPGRGESGPAEVWAAELRWHPAGARIETYPPRSEERELDLAVILGLFVPRLLAHRVNSPPEAIEQSTQP